MKKHLFLIVAIAVSLAGSLCSGAYGQSKPKVTKVKPAAPAKKKPDATPTESAEPDKVLYDRAVTAVKHSRFTEARLDFQTLINTYPDSEYLAKAKLGIADSFYKEGGVSNLTQSVEEYKNFIVFFPFLDEASYAQMQVAMAHYKMMEKADRDTSQAEAAEDEFRAFLLKYPQSPLVPSAEQNLRNVQEILADGQFRIAQFYYRRPDYRAATARLLEVTQRYPLYSQSDEALWMLGEIYLRAKQTSKNEDARNQWADFAGQCYDRILQDYPLSSLAPNAKERLKSMGMPIPAAKPDALARMQKQQIYEKDHHQVAALKFPMEMIKSTPDVYAAARNGQPNLNPPDDAVSATEVLNPGAVGPSFTVAAAGISTGGEAKPAVDTESVDTATTPDTSTSSAAPAQAAGIQMLDAPSNDTIQNSAPAASSAAPADAPAASATTDNTAAPNASSDAAPASTAPTSTAPQAETSTSQAAQPASTGTAQAAAQPATDKNDPSTESSSKKKKGLQKLVPW